MKRLNQILSQISDIYGTERVCLGPKDCLLLKPGLISLLSSIKEPMERKKKAWIAWHDTVGRKFRPLYIEYKKLKNKLAVVRGYRDYGEDLRDRYGKISFDQEVKLLYEGILPLYKELHAYVRRRLNDHYKLEQPKYIKQHLLGDMWGRFWTHLYSIAVPFLGRTQHDLSETMKKQNYTVEKMFLTAQDFYVSLGLKPLPSSFFNLSMLEKPSDRDVVCHPTAWDFFDSKDFRISMCTRISFDDLLT
ncbi:unnamed protein product, partial [Allacma fusca]